MKKFKIVVQGVNQVHAFEVKADKLFMSKDQPGVVQFYKGVELLAVVPTERVLVLCESESVSQG